MQDLTIREVICNRIFNTCASWTSGNAFIYQVEGVTFKSRAGANQTQCCQLATAVTIL